MRETACMHGALAPPTAVCGPSRFFCFVFFLVLFFFDFLPFFVFPFLYGLPFIGGFSFSLSCLSVCFALFFFVFGPMRRGMDSWCGYL